ncbi:MAG: 4Fe-4S dicluster domain-containing protein [Nitrospirae bacterium]|nr:4Fe-4S dicluster domain-containing protein [Nitrospirota bacterium]
MARYGMVIDLSKCMGCRACMEACKTENGTPLGHFFMYTFRWEEGTYPSSTIRFLPRPCNHCDNPPCVKACPYDARIKWKGGLVLTDVDNCRGVRYCEQACPYGVNYFNAKKPEENYGLDYGHADLASTTGGAVPPYWKPELEKAYSWDEDPKKKIERRVAGAGHRENTVGKCTFCVHRLENGITKTACQQACPVGAIIFGDLDDAGSDVAKALASRKSETFRLKDVAQTEPKVYFIGKAPAAAAHLIEQIPIPADVQKLGKTEYEGGTIPW